MDTSLFFGLDSCWICQKPLWRARYFCGFCRKEILSLELISRRKMGLEILSLFQYREPVEALIRLGKGAGAPQMTATLAQFLTTKFLWHCPWIVAAVIPIPPKIPGHRDHAGVIAEAVAARLEVPVWQHLLERIPQGAAQKEKNVSERSAAPVRLRETADITLLPRDKLVLIVDDVATTGSTLLAAWRELGLPPAMGLTLASTPKHTPGLAADH
jgi:predicted amidophosphoribosyltransferase